MVDNKQTVQEQFRTEVHARCPQRTEHVLERIVPNNRNMFNGRSVYVNVWDYQDSVQVGFYFERSSDAYNDCVEEDIVDCRGGRAYPQTIEMAIAEAQEFIRFVSAGEVDIRVVED